MLSTRILRQYCVDPKNTVRVHDLGQMASSVHKACLQRRRAVADICCEQFGAKRSLGMTGNMVDLSQPPSSALAMTMTMTTQDIHMYIHKYTHRRRMDASRRETSPGCTRRNGDSTIGDRQRSLAVHEVVAWRAGVRDGGRIYLTLLSPGVCLSTVLI